MAKITGADLRFIDRRVAELAKMAIVAVDAAADCEKQGLPAIAEGWRRSAIAHRAELDGMAYVLGVANGFPAANQRVKMAMEAAAQALVEERAVMAAANAAILAEWEALVKKGANAAILDDWEALVKKEASARR